MRRLRGENGRVSKGLGLRMHLPDNGAVARSLLAVLVLTAAALLWGPAGAATSTAAAGAIAGAIALQDNPLGRIPIVFAVSVELGIAVFAGGLTSGYSIVFVIVVAVWCFLAGMQWAVGAAAGLLAGASGLVLVIQHPQPALAALASAVLAVIAGLTQAALIAVWPPRRWQLERDALTQGVPVAECRREAAGHRGGRGGRFVAAAGVQGSVQRTRGPVRPSLACVPRLARAAGTDRQDVDGLPRQGRRQRRDRRPAEGGGGHARRDRCAEQDGAAGRGVRASGCGRGGRSGGDVGCRCRAATFTSTAPGRCTAVRQASPPGLDRCVQDGGADRLCTSQPDVADIAACRPPRRGGGLRYGDRALRRRSRGLLDSVDGVARA